MKLTYKLANSDNEIKFATRHHNKTATGMITMLQHALDEMTEGAKRRNEGWVDVYHDVCVKLVASLLWSGAVDNETYEFIHDFTWDAWIECGRYANKPAIKVTVKVKEA